MYSAFAITIPGIIWLISTKNTSTPVPRMFSCARAYAQGAAITTDSRQAPTATIREVRRFCPWSAIARE